MCQNHDIIKRHAVVGNSGLILITCGFFNVQPMYGTWVILHFPPINMLPLRPGLDSVTLG